ncbi:hypothetical protein [Megalodesulfovibrio paquesii]
MPAPWDRARPGDVVAVRLEPGRYARTTLARAALVVDGRLCVKPAGYPWTPLGDCVLDGVPGPALGEEEAQEQRTGELSSPAPPPVGGAAGESEAKEVQNGC